MNKLLLLLALIFALVVAQEHVGDYKEVPKEVIDNLIDSLTFEEIELVARKHFTEKEHITLGKILAIEEQIVAGVSYKILFESDKGHYEVSIFVQPWTNKIEVTGYEKK